MNALRRVALIAVVVLSACGAPTSDGTATCGSETCEDVSGRFADDVERIRSAHDTCATTSDCEAVIPSLGCEEKTTWLSQCHVGVAVAEVTAFHDEIAVLVAQFCDDCTPECYQGPDCPTTFAADCVDGHCTIAVVED